MNLRISSSSLLALLSNYLRGNRLLASAAALVALCVMSIQSYAQTVVFDFDQHPVRTDNYVSGVFLPYTEEGLRLSSNKHVQIPGLLHQTYAGVKTFAPTTNGVTATYTLQSVGINGGNPQRFNVRSLRLHPLMPGNNQSVTFTGQAATGVTTSLTVQTGTAMSGTLVTFGAGFQNLTMLSWTVSTNVHQISDFIVDYQQQVSAPSTITVPEGIGSVSVPISLNYPVAVDTPFRYSVAGTTATLNSDFQNPGGASAPANGSAQFLAGTQSTTITIPILNDTAVEQPEEVRLQVFNGTTELLWFPNFVVASYITIASDDGITNFAGWMAAHGLSGNNALPYADANGDGISNIEAWLFRLNPAGASPAAWLERRATYFTTAANVPGLRLTIPTPLPSDVRLIFDETTTLSSWPEQTRRTGFGTGSLWTGTGASRVVESNSVSARTITLPGSASRTAREKAFFRLKYEHVSGSAE